MINARLNQPITNNVPLIHNNKMKEVLPETIENETTVDTLHHRTQTAK